MFKRHIHILILTVAAIIISSIPSCVCKEGPLTDPSVTKVMLLYSAGFNSLSSFLKEDISDLSSGWLPKKKSTEDVILVYAHHPSVRGQYSTKTTPVLYRLYSKSDGTIARDTLVRYSTETISSSAEQLNSVLSYIKDEFPAKGYGMIFSSHATGYLPAGFYSNPNDYVYSDRKMKSVGRNWESSPVPVPYIEPEHDPNLPAVKSVGQDVNGQLSYEMDIRDFAEAIPMKLDYLLFDACLMGGIEVAYELAGKCDKLGFSQAEVLAEGFNYRTLASHLLGNKSESNPESVCRDYFTQYDIQSGVYRSATISLIDCDELEPLAEVCSVLFEKYSEKIATLPYINVQRFYRDSYHWFYDLESILIHAGISESELEQLHNALNRCVIYKGATPSFMGSFKIETFSGFSMYLPSHGHDELDKYYRNLKWNQSTELVK